MQMWYFRPGYDEKSYTHHGSKIGQPTLFATLVFGSRVAINTSYGLFKFFGIPLNSEIVLLHK